MANRSTGKKPQRDTQLSGQRTEAGQEANKPKPGDSTATPAASPATSKETRAESVSSTNRAVTQAGTGDR
jgi:hypothetical protein